MTILDEIQTSIRRHAEGAGSSVVGIGQRRGVGWGIVLADGRVLTNAHNVRGDQVTVTLQGAPGGTLELRVVRGADERTAQVVFTPEVEGK
jgi:S1-C subfamily serine protease